MNIVDIVIIVLLALSMYNGFRKGAISSIVSLIGTIIAFILAFYLKTPISIFLYEHLPFLSLKGIFENITVINILIYEGISFILTFFILLLLLKLLLRITGIFDAIMNKIILLGLPSKIIGAFVGFIQGYLVLFLVLFVIITFNKPSTYITESKLSNIIIYQTPGVSNTVNKTVKIVDEIYDICMNNTDKEQANLDSLDVLMKYEVLTYESANKLIENGKLKMNNAQSVIEKYKDGYND